MKKDTVFMQMMLNVVELMSHYQEAVRILTPYAAVANLL